MSEIGGGEFLHSGFRIEYKDYDKKACSVSEGGEECDSKDIGLFGEMKQGDRRKDRGQYQAVQLNNVGLYRSVSSPGTISNYERDVERREVVVGGYGVPPGHLVYPGGIPAIQSPSVTIFNSGIQDKDAGVKGRKRPGRKTRQGDGYGSSPDGHASPPHQNGSYLDTFAFRLTRM